MLLLLRAFIISNYALIALIGDVYHIKRLISRSCTSIAPSTTCREVMLFRTMSIVDQVIVII